jgi:hypothetical protein
MCSAAICPSCQRHRAEFQLEVPTELQASDMIIDGPEGAAELLQTLL